MNKKSLQNGYSTLYALLMVTIISTLVILGSSPDIYMGRQLKKEINTVNTELQLEEAVNSLIMEMMTDPTPLADCKEDPAWIFAENYSKNNISLTLKDISTGINLNAMDPIWLEQVYVKSPSTLRDKRLQSFFRTKEDVEEFIDANSFETLFSLYGYINPNITDTPTLTRYIESRMGPDKKDISSSLAVALKSGTASTPRNQKEINIILGQYQDEIAPMVMALPPINVNMASRELLEPIISFPYQGKGFKDSASILQHLMTDKLIDEVYPSDLLNLFNSLKEEELFLIEYPLTILGTQTWFWQITAELPDTIALDVIIVRLPSTYSESPIQFQVIEKKWRDLS